MNAPVCACAACQGGEPIFCTNTKRIIDDLRTFQAAREKEILRLTVENENLRRIAHPLGIGRDN